MPWRTKSAGIPEFPARLRAVRESRGLLQKELGQKIGISRQSIMKYEQGLRVPEAFVSLELANILNVSLDFLMGRLGPESLIGTTIVLDVPDDIGVRVRDYRTKRGLSQEKLEELSGVHQAKISAIETGILRPNRWNVVQIARGLDVYVDELVGRNRTIVEEITRIAASLQDDDLLMLTRLARFMELVRSERSK